MASSKSEEAELIVSPELSTTIEVLIIGMILEINIRGLLSSFSKLAAKNGSPFVMWLIIAGNCFSLMLAISSIWLLFTTEENYTAVKTVVNIAYQLFYTTFDAFLLFKTSRVWSHTRWFVVVSSIFMANRIGWAIYELGSAREPWSSQTSLTAQNVLSASGVLASDIACDVFCTVMTILLVCKMKTHSEKPNPLFAVLWQENCKAYSSMIGGLTL
ncbi:hypothetical protein BCR33DRAFT_744557 [Rhizoclosmatium globosum]|uniref:Uncharacterized protein n=1 Tax=Rhizoclosmatium globosum TaxID=329046 RepID=A0A1Y2B9D3_9FUNG|nr:hypothetical protein BCR33DRAFT_744557 [Rhizoclosmatium globosum]|eukprot:ORY31452.1 hypothetical protein BCR33DRAFT_744557 [Rhizoclosmatium globosum]